MNIRSTTVALATPDPLRGRVNAVEAVFVSASNQLGAFESGLAGVDRLEALEPREPRDGAPAAAVA